MNSLVMTLEKLNKAYYTISDLKKITGMAQDSLYVTLSRLIKNKSLIRLTSGIYTIADKYSQIEVIANTLYQPSYLSFESALSRYGILSQVPYTLTFATTKKSLRKKLGDVSVEYRKLKRELFFGYEKVESLFIATPEKALLDTLYLVSFGKFSIGLDQLDLKEISTKGIKKIATKFPERTRQLFNKMV